PTTCSYTACDFFNRSDTTTQLGMTTTQTGFNYSGQAETGQPWQTDGTSWGIASTQAYVISPTATGNYARLGTSFNATQTVAITVRTSGFNGQAGLIARTTSDWSTYMAWVGMDSSGNVEVWELANGDWGSGAIATGTTAVSYPR